MKKTVNDSRRPTILAPKSVTKPAIKPATNHTHKPKSKPAPKPVPKPTPKPEPEPLIKSFCIVKEDPQQSKISQPDVNILENKQDGTIEPLRITPKVLPSGFSPAQIKTAYNFPAYPALATPTTTRPIIAVVAAYGYSGSAYGDLKTYCQTFGIPYPKNGGTLVNARKLPLGMTNNPYFFEWNPTKKISNNSEWTFEMALDTQTAWSLTQQPGSGIATNGPHIILFHGASASASAMLTAVNAAVTMGASVVSMSFGAGVFISSFETLFFNNASANKNVVFVASSGDYNTSNYPSTSTYVLSAGGTRLQLNQDNTRLSEIYWFSRSGNTIIDGSGTGKMPMPLTSNPTFNTFSAVYTNGGNPLTTGTFSKNTPDLSGVAAPSTGYAIYVNRRWYVIGGTSLTAPMFASYLINVNQNRLNNLKAQLTQLQLMTCLYSQNTQSCLYQIDNTNNGTPIINNTPDTITITNGVTYELYNGLGAILNNLSTQLQNL
ncbi:MAG: hypothetical protein EB127_24335 [Alphaproteobacteria bacterium]|nr:hypothetical protein [Alphaproteobacteria bacterium]